MTNDEFSPRRDVRFIFFIGFNKCGTTSFHVLANKSRIPSVHGRDGETYLGQLMMRNLAEGRRPLIGVEHFAAFSDFIYLRQGTLIEACLNFRDLHQAYPESYFVLNTRDEDAWVRSRSNHVSSYEAGTMLERVCQTTGRSKAEVIEGWRHIFRSHHAACLEYFAGNPRFLVFDIAQDNPAKLAAHLSADYSLDVSYWGQRNKTERVAHAAQ